MLASVKHYAKHGPSGGNERVSDVGVPTTGAGGSPAGTPKLEPGGRASSADVLATVSGESKVRVSVARWQNLMRGWLLPQNISLYQNLIPSSPWIVPG